MLFSPFLCVLVLVADESAKIVASETAEVVARRAVSVMLCGAVRRLVPPLRPLPIETGPAGVKRAGRRAGRQVGRLAVVFHANEVKVLGADHEGKVFLCWLRQFDLNYA